MIKVRSNIQQRIARIFTCTINDLTTTYLRMPMFKSGMKEALWYPKIERFSNKL